MYTRCLIFLFIAALFAVASCKDNDSVIAPKVTTFLNVINASADTLNFYLNGTRQNNAASLVPVSYSTYLDVPEGLQNYQFKKAGASAILFSVPLTLVDSTYYSLYVTGESADKAFYTLDGLTIKADTLPAITKLRFVNAAPDIGNLTVSVGDTIQYKSVAFKSSSSFLSLGSGQKLIKVYLDGSTVFALDTTMALSPQHEYTIYAKGLKSGNGNSKFNVGLVINY